MPNSAQHTIRYRKEGDYGNLVPKVVIVEYVNGFNPEWACEACVFNRGEHSDWCKHNQLKLEFLEKSETLFG